MEEQVKKTVHITWQEVLRAEAERDKARQKSCRPMPPTGMKLIAIHLARYRSKLKAPAIEVDAAGSNSQTLENRHDEAKDSPSRAIRKAPSWLLDDQPLNVSTVVIVFAIILLAVGMVSYSQHSKNDMSHLAELRGTAPHSAFPVLPAKPSAPAFGTNRSSFKREQEPDKSVLPVNEAAAKLARNPIAAAESPILPREPLGTHKAQSMEPQLSSNHESIQNDGRKGTAEKVQGSLGNFEVVANSFVRDQPQSNAAIIGTLRRGMQVSVESKTGDYLHIRSLNNPDLIGYVHEEDAFFQAH